MYKNIGVQFSAPFWYRWPIFGLLAHGLRQTDGRYQVHYLPALLKLRGR